MVAYDQSGVDQTSLGWDRPAWGGTDQPGVEGKGFEGWTDSSAADPGSLKTKGGPYRSTSAIKRVCVCVCVCVCVG